MLFFEVYDFAERAEVAVHGEDRFGDDEGTAFARDEELFELVEVVVRKDAEGGSGESRGVDEAGVGELVEDDLDAIAEAAEAYAKQFDSQ